MIRQGDVLLIPTQHRLTPDATLVPRHQGWVVLAFGEMTGHAHVIVEPEPALAELFEEKDGRLFLRVERPCELRHAESLETMRASGEHGSQILDRPIYEVRRQRQYTPQGIRRVSD